jgi:hypothetical protein
MSVGDVNGVDHTGSVDPSTGDLHGSNPALAAQFQAHLRLARQNMTAGPRYAFNNTQPNQTATDASPRFNFQQPDGPTVLCRRIHSVARLSHPGLADYWGCLAVNLA